MQRQEGSWGSITSDCSGQYLAATSDGFIYISTSGNYIIIFVDVFSKLSNIKIGGESWSMTAVPHGDYGYIIRSDRTGKNLVAAGTNSGILLSTSGGVTWRRSAAPTGVWGPIASDQTGMYLVAAQTWPGPPEYIYTSSDWGDTWTQSSSPAGQWNTLVSDSSGRYLAAGGPSNIYTSSDYGSTWTLTTAPIAYYPSIASDRSGKYLAAVQYIDAYRNPGYIWTSTNYGASWTQSLSPAGQWAAITSDSSGKYLAAAVQYWGGVYVSTSYGSMWSQTELPSSTGDGDHMWLSLASSCSGSSVAIAGTFGIYTASTPSLTKGNVLL